MSKHNFTQPNFEGSEVYAEVICTVCGQVAKKYKFKEFYKYLGNGEWVTACPPCKKPSSEPVAKDVLRPVIKPTDAYQFTVPADCRTGKDDKKPVSSDIRITYAPVIPKVEQKIETIRKVEPMVESQVEPVVETVEESPVVEEQTKEIATNPHVYKRREIPSHTDKVIETCACGMISYRYADDSRKYIKKGVGLVDEPEVLNCYIDHSVVEEKEDIGLKLEDVLVQTPREIIDVDVDKLSSEPIVRKKHKFARVEIPEGEKFAIEYCECGVKSLRYKVGGREYYDSNGKNVPWQSCTRAGVKKPTVDRKFKRTKISHKYERLPVPEGQLFVMETCSCGAKSARYSNGFRTYFNTEGKQIYESTSCTRVIEQKPTVVKIVKPAKSNPISIKPSVPTVDEPLIKVDEANIITDKTRRIFSDKLSTSDARLVDAYVIIKVMFEEMIKNNLNTIGMNMAGRLLYSDGYAEFTKSVKTD